MEHFRRRPPGSNLALPSSQGSCAAFLREGNIVGRHGWTWSSSSQPGARLPGLPGPDMELAQVAVDTELAQVATDMELAGCPFRPFCILLSWA